MHRAVNQAPPVEHVGPLLEMAQETHLLEEFQVIRTGTAIHALDATVVPRAQPRPGRTN
jgi:hypothetical protein